MARTRGACHPSGVSLFWRVVTINGAVLAGAPR